MSPFRDFFTFQANSIPRFYFTQQNIENIFNTIGFALIYIKTFFIIYFPFFFLAEISRPKFVGTLILFIMIQVMISKPQSCFVYRNYDYEIFVSGPSRKLECAPVTFIYNHGLFFTCDLNINPAFGFPARLILSRVKPRARIFTRKRGQTITDPAFSISSRICPTYSLTCRPYINKKARQVQYKKRGLFLRKSA